MTRLTGATVCSGIGGAELAGKDIDWQWCAEILQGFPDNWTLVRKNEKGDYYSAYKRYHGVGNSWSVNVAEYVLDRIKAVDQLPDLVA